VANNSCGFSNSFNARFAFLESSLFKRSFSAGPKEKYATSEPEIKAEKINNTSIKSRYIMIVPAGIAAKRNGVKIILD
jgi:hypothetical protein